MKKISVAISPCPNDTFMFWWLINFNKTIEGYNLDIAFADIEELNSIARKGQADLCKISYAQYPTIASNYQILDSGSALGRNCGPLLITRPDINISDLSELSCAIPGMHTTANFLLNFTYPELKNKTEIIFSDIENKVADGTYDCGVIIHENRFTYQEKGLIKIKDLGLFWENKTSHPIPLGAISIRRSLPEKLKYKINSLLKRSIQNALRNPVMPMDFVTSYAQEMNPNVMKKHIDLYVNSYSVSLGKDGQNAVNHLFHEKSKQENKIFSFKETFIGG